MRLAVRAVFLGVAVFIVLEWIAVAVDRGGWWPFATGLVVAAAGAGAALFVRADIAEVERHR